MKICHVASHEGVYRGGAVQLCRMALAQKERGHNVAVVVYQRAKRPAAERARDADTWKPLTDSGIRVEFVDYARPRGLLRLRWILRSGAFDIVHAHRDQALRAVYLSTLWLHGPKIVAQRGTTSIPGFFVSRILRSRRVGAVVAVAKAVKDVLAESVRVDARKIRVVYGSVDLGKFAPRALEESLRTRLGISTDANVIGSLSAYRKAKGLEKLMKSLAPVLQSHPTAHAVFLGSNIPEKLAPTLNKLNLAARCHLLDHQSDVAGWLAAMNITVVAATEREGLSGVLRESLAMEIPVISTDCSGNGEIVRDKVTGLLVPAGNVAAMSDALSWALDHPAEMKAMAKAGRAWVSENCSPEFQSQALERIYETLLQN
ncbi:glycosyltransferase family 4 protein [Candidatus Sumerlaeota bacterium]|nr:glycosyltransferase family 4 protein [Candidatus Sumerlaeota bacterium]